MISVEECDVVICSYKYFVLSKPFFSGWVISVRNKNEWLLKYDKHLPHT